MDREKLNKAAKREAYNGYSGSYKDRRDGFIKGAEWLMQQPLSERLTEEEKEKIKALYNEYHAHIFHIELEGIFGSDLFNDK